MSEGDTDYVAGFKDGRDAAEATIATLTAERDNWHDGFNRMESMYSVKQGECATLIAEVERLRGALQEILHKECVTGYWLREIARSTLAPTQPKEAR